MSGPEEDATVPAATLPTRSGGSLDADARSELAPGTEIGRYRLVSRLGAGAMGEVWAATDPQLDRQVAIKLVHPRLARDPEISARMVREARAMAKVSHRAVIAIHDAGEGDGRLFLAMELVRGKTLGALLRDRGQVGDWRHWLRIMIEAGRGLAAAHAAGVLHRDFKPDNVMVDDRGRVCVGDFGLASVADGPRPRVSRPVLGAIDTDLTMTGALLGTPAYMSLEQLYGEPVDARADQFSFCVATFEALYGKRPFAVEPTGPATIVALGEAIAAGQIRGTPAGSDVPAAVHAIIARGLAKSPADRWPNLDALLAALEHELAPSSRTPWRFIAIAGALAVIAVAIAILVRRPTPPVAHASAHLVSPIPLRAGLAMSPHGRVALVTERIEVRDLATGQTWTMRSTKDKIWIAAVQFVGENVLRWADHQDPGVTWRWDFVAGTAAVAESDLGSRWLGAVAEGDLIERADHSIALTTGGAIVRTWPGDVLHSDQLSVSPSGHRFAYLVSGHFEGHIVVGDSATGARWQSTTLVEPAGLGWLTDDTLLYATADGAIDEVTLGASGFGEPRRVYQLAAGWAGRILVADGRIRFSSHVPVTRVRVIDRESGSVRDLEPSIAAAELGWMSNGMFVIWDRTTHALERTRLTGRGDPIPAKLAREPANATLAGDLVLASLRDIGGRKLVAVSMTTGATAWEDPVGRSLVARCANDVAPPCFVARRTHEADHYEVLALDPLTGATSGSPIYRGVLEDLAVNADGTRLLIADGTSQVREIDLAGNVTSTFDRAMSTVRSVAYDPRGGVITSAIFGDSYAVAHQDASHTTVLTQSDGELLSMVRPSANGQVLILGRTIVSELWELELPP